MQLRLDAFQVEEKSQQSCRFCCVSGMETTCLSPVDVEVSITVLPSDALLPIALHLSVQDIANLSLVNTEWRQHMADTRSVHVSVLATATVPFHVGFCPESRIDMVP